MNDIPSGSSARHQPNLLLSNAMPHSTKRSIPKRLFPSVLADKRLVTTFNKITTSLSIPRQLYYLSSGSRRKSPTENAPSPAFTSDDASILAMSLNLW